MSKSTSVTRLRTLTKKLGGPRSAKGETFIVLNNPVILDRKDLITPGKVKSITIEQVGKNSALVDEEGNFYDAFEFVKSEEEVCAVILAEII